MNIKKYLKLSWQQYATCKYKQLMTCHWLIIYNSAHIKMSFLYPGVMFLPGWTSMKVLFSYDAGSVQIYFFMPLPYRTLFDKYAPKSLLYVHFLSSTRPSDVRLVMIVWSPAPLAEPCPCAGASSSLAVLSPPSALDVNNSISLAVKKKKNKKRAGHT